jgi:hypothetical protein
MKRLIPSAFVAISLLGGGTCQVVRAQAQAEAQTSPYTDQNPSNYTDQRTYRHGYGGWGLLGLCGLFGLLGARRTRTYETPGRMTERNWEPRPTH